MPTTATWFLNAIARSSACTMRCSRSRLGVSRHLDPG